jgi:hypothetical protein
LMICRFEFTALSYHARSHRSAPDSLGAGQPSCRHQCRLARPNATSAQPSGKPDCYSRDAH